MKKTTNSSGDSNIKSVGDQERTSRNMRIEISVVETGTLEEDMKTDLSGGSTRGF